MAIRQDTLTSQNNDKEKALYSIKKLDLATLWHCTDMPGNQDRHAIYHRESNSWCKYWQNGDSEDHKSSVNLSKLSKIYLCQYF